MRGLEAMDIARQAVLEGLQAPDPDLVWISIVLGIIEESLTRKKDPEWPIDLKVGVTRGAPRSRTGFDTRSSSGGL